MLEHLARPFAMLVGLIGLRGRQWRSFSYPVYL